MSVYRTIGPLVNSKIEVYRGIPFFLIFSSPEPKAHKVSL